MRRAQDRAQADQTQLCFHFLRGACRMGDKCKFTHSVDAYLASRPPDLPGECPFKSLPQCPYGIRCRWASKHEHPDELTRQHIIEPAALARRTCDAEDHSAAAGHGTSGARAHYRCACFISITRRSSTTISVHAVELHSCFVSSAPCTSCVGH